MLSLVLFRHLYFNVVVVYLWRQVGTRVSAVSRKTNTTHREHLGVHTKGDTQLVCVFSLVADKSVASEYRSPTNV